MEKSKIKIYELGILLCAISLYVFPRILRYHYNIYLSYFNILFYIGLIIFISKSKKNNVSINRSKNLVIPILLFCITSILICLSHDYTSAQEIVGYIFSNSIPIFVIYELIEYKNDNMKKFTDIWYSFTKIACMTMVFLWLLDQIMNNNIQYFFLNYYKIDSLYSMYFANRFISFYGHSLVIAIMMFTLLLWTLVLYDNGKKNKYFLFTILVSMIGIAITGSKSILLLAILLLIIFFVNKKNFKYIIPLFIIIFVLYKMGIFNTTLTRLSTGLEAGDLSTNRNISIETMINQGTLKFNLIKGHDIDRENGIIIAALEYPILRWAYNSGILFSLLLFLVYFIKPLITVIRKKNIRFIFAIILYMLAVNISDGLASSSDAILFFIINICLLNYVAKSKNLEQKNGEKIYEQNKSNDVNRSYW